MKINAQWLIDKKACDDSVKWLGDRSLDAVECLDLLIKEDCLNWAGWGIVRVMNRQDCLRYAVYAAKQVLEIFERKYPKDKRPRNAIEAAMRVLKNDTEQNRTAAAYAAYAAAYASSAAAYAASAASAAASAAAYDAAAAVSAAAVDAADAATRKKTCLKILKYGRKLLVEAEGKKA